MLCHLELLGWWNSVRICLNLVYCRNELSDHPNPYFVDWLKIWYFARCRSIDVCRGLSKMKHISPQFHSNDNQIRKRLKSFGWGGERRKQCLYTLENCGRNKNCAFYLLLLFSLFHDLKSQIYIAVCLIGISESELRADVFMNFWFVVDIFFRLFISFIIFFLFCFRNRL